MNVDKLGQVFTPQITVKQMIELKKNNGTVLEPSCGDGAFSMHFKGCTAIEYDETKAPDYALNMDFFDYPVSNQFDTIIGNPPYVRYQNIMSDTKDKLDMKLFDKRSNLYLFFIYKCIQHLSPHGELIFIVPRDFLKATSSIKLNKYIYDNGTITDLISLNDEKVFAGASPNTVIFRFEKDNFSRTCNNSQTFTYSNGQLLFTAGKNAISFSDLFFVKVGAVSGADKYFINENGNVNFVCSKTKTDNKLRKMFYNVNAPELEPYKNELLNRKIKLFSEENWYMWGRSYYVSDAERLYVNAKTRQSNPFFYNSCKAYDGSVLAIFPKFKADVKTLTDVANELNKVDWNELGFMCGDRYLFSQKTLENTILPNAFVKYKKLL